MINSEWPLEPIPVNSTEKCRLLQYRVGPGSNAYMRTKLEQFRVLQGVLVVQQEGDC